MTEGAFKLRFSEAFVLEELRGDYEYAVRASKKHAAEHKHVLELIYNTKAEALERVLFLLGDPDATARVERRREEARATRE